MNAHLARRRTARLVVPPVAALMVLTGFGAMSPASADPAPVIPAHARAAATAIPAKFWADPMQLGQRDHADGYLGRPVAMTQYLLRRWSPGLAVDGSFGYGTKAAVEKFQRGEGLAVTGKLQRADFYRLFVRQTVRYGSTGDSVRAVQMYLRERAGHPVAMDGSFGPTTRTYVLVEQRTHGRCHSTGVDGIVGPMTRAMFYEGEHDSGPC